MRQLISVVYMMYLTGLAGKGSGHLGGDCVAKWSLKNPGVCRVLRGRYE